MVCSTATEYAFLRLDNIRKKQDQGNMQDVQDVRFVRLVPAGVGNEKKMEAKSP
jgi:hypothetical protein